MKRSVKSATNLNKIVDFLETEFSKLGRDRGKIKLEITALAESFETYSQTSNLRRSPN